MPDQRFLLVRLGSLGDIIHALPAASALRDAFPEARIDWLIEPKWRRLLEGNPDLTEIIPLEKKSASGLISTIRKLRAARYTCAIDFQGLYKSALPAFASAPRDASVSPAPTPAKALHQFSTPIKSILAEHIKLTTTSLSPKPQARPRAPRPPRFPLTLRPEDEKQVTQELARHNIADFYVLNPGGGWRSKCWPPERYGELHHRLAAQLGWRSVISFGPGEERLAQELVSAAGTLPPVVLPLGLGPLMALLRRAKFVVSADTGPLHLASALGTPVVGLYGPTDPARNGPYGGTSVVIRNPSKSETTYRRGASYSSPMLSITVDQVADAVARLLDAKS